MSEEEDLDDFQAALRLGEKILEMCERVHTAGKLAPGAVAASAVEIDGVRYEITAKVAPKDGA